MTQTQHTAGQEHLSLKFGTLKGWKCTSEASKEALRRYAEGGVSWSLVSQKDTDEQKQALRDLIEAIDGPIYNDWDGEVMTKEQAKEYIRSYGAAS